MPYIASIPQTRQQILEMRERLTALHDSPSSGEDTRKSVMHHIKHCDFLLQEIDAGELVPGVLGDQ